MAKRDEKTQITLLDGTKTAFRSAIPAYTTSNFSKKALRKAALAAKFNWLTNNFQDS